jgi:DNA-binding PadR family transcriptional regulator
MGPANPHVGVRYSERVEVSQGFRYIRKSFDMRRFFRHGELHLVLLALLAERQPMHGYELMGEIDERFQPEYRASAGSIYPALQALSAEGLIDEDDGSDPGTYRLTSSGAQALASRIPQLVRLEERTGVALGAVAEVEDALRRLTIAAREAGRTEDRDQTTALLDETTERLKELTRGRTEV